MITIPESIQKDLITDINNFDVMAVISSANDTFYISTKQQYFEDNYYEDLDLRVSGLKESINFNSKKVKMSGTTISLNNYEINGKRFTDRAKYGLANATVEIYLKTGSCESLEDCAKLATLKVTRFDQDKEKVTIKCEEYLTQSLNTELPKKEYTLYSEDNEGAALDGKTYEVYNEQRIPILYGHLKEAPAITYIDNETNKIKVLPDNAYISNYEIGGIKRISPIEYPNYYDSNTNLTQLVDQDCLTVKLGDGGARVLKSIYKQSNLPILVDTFDTQFDINNSYVEFYTEEDNVPRTASQYINQSILLVSENSKLKNANIFKNVYTIPTNGNGTNYYGRNDFSNTINEIDYKDSDLFTTVSAQWGDLDNPQGQGYHPIPYSSYLKGGVGQILGIGGSNHYIIDNASLELEFEEIKSSPDVASDNFGNKFASDFHLISFIEVNMAEGTDDIGAETFSQPVLRMCMFPKKANNSFGDLMTYGSYGDGSGFQSDTPIGFAPNVINGLTDPGFDSIPGGYYGDIGFGFPEGSEGFSYFFNNNTDAGVVEYFTDAIRLTSAKRITEFRMKFSTGSAVPPFGNDQYTRPITDYRHSFSDTWNNRIVPSLNYSAHDMRSMIINIFPDDDDDGFEFNTRLNLHAKFNGMILRRVWYQNNALNNKFFINSRGRVSPFDNSLSQRVKKITGADIYYISRNKVPSEDYHQTSNDDALKYILDYIGNDKLKYESIDDVKHEIMIKYTIDSSATDPSELRNETGYIYDLDINQIYTEYHTEDTSHIVKINGSMFRDTNSNGFTSSIDDGYIYIDDIRLVYAKKDINKSTGDIEGITEIEESEVINLTGMPFIDAQDLIPEFSSRVGMIIKSGNISELKKVIKMPKLIAKDLMNREFGQGDFETKNTADSNYELNFSIDKPQKTIDVLQQVAQNTNFFYKTGLSNSKPTVIGMKNTYAGDDVDKTILVDYIESYKFSKTNIEDLAVKCRVKYGYDYITESFKHVTEEVQVTNTEDYKAYYGLTDNDIDGDEFLLEHEAPYIQDEPTAILLRNHLHELHKNQHTIVDFKINLSQGFELEVGDTINFKAIGDGDYKSFFSPYGVDIMSVTGLPFLPGIEDQQAVLPYFMITDINKTMDSVSIKAIQIHELIGLTQIPEPPIDDDDDTGDDDTGDDDTGDDDTWQDLTPNFGDINDNGTPYETADYLLLLGYITYGQQESGAYNFSEQQIRNSDINDDGNVDALDLVAFMDNYIETMEDSYNPGDVTGDGYVTQDDVDAAQAYVDDPVANPLSLNAIANGDIAEPRDGMITAEDVAAIDAIKKVPPAEVDPIGDLLIDTTWSDFGVIAMYHSEDNIVIELPEVGGDISEISDLYTYLEELSTNNLTLVGTNITFQPILTGDLQSPQYYPWLSAAGYYTIESITLIPNAIPQLDKIAITLDAPEIDGSNLIGIGTSPEYAGESGNTNVKIYGTPEPIVVDPDPDGDGYVELLSTSHHYETSGLTTDFGNYACTDNYLQFTPSSGTIITGSDNSIVSSGTLSDIIDNFSHNPSTFYKVNVAFHQEYQDYTDVILSDSTQEIIDNWLRLDGFYFQMQVFNSTLMRLKFNSCLNANGEDTNYMYNSLVGGHYLDTADGNNIVIPLPSGLTTNNSIEDYIIFTISYPLESNE